MSSTYSSYKIELIGTGEQAGTWGTTTNTNLGTTLEQAIGGYTTVNFTGLTKTLTLTNTNAAQDARALYLNLTGTPGGAATLEIPAIQKAYIIKNATTGGFAVTAKVVGMTGVVIPNGSTMMVYNNGTDVVVANDNFNGTLTLSDVYMTGSLGMSGPTTGGAVSNIRIRRRLTGATSAIGVYSDWTVASDVTSGATTYRSDIITDAAAFTLPFAIHYGVQGLTVGAGSTVTDQRAFNVGTGTVGATNNYGLYSFIPAAANNWNLYLSGTANNYMAGALGIGTTTLAGYKIRTGGALDGSGGGAADIYNNSTIQSSVTSVYYGRRSVPATQAAAFTLPVLYHNMAESVSIGAGSTVTSQHGYYASGVGATNNYAFTGAIASSANNWNLYNSGTANNYMAGALGIGTTAVSNLTNLRISRSLTGGTTQYSIMNQPAFMSDVTVQGVVYRSLPSTEAAAFTLPSLSHFLAEGTTIGASSAVTQQFGFYAGSNLTGGAQNYGFYGNIPASGSNNWNFYAQGTAPNYMAGALGIGATTLTGYNLAISRQLTGATTVISVRNVFSVASDVTTAVYGNQSQISTAAAAFTVPNVYNYVAEGVTVGSGSTVTNATGFQISSGFTTATNNYAIYSNVPSGGANNWNLYAQGTAPNYMAGALGIGSTSVANLTNLRIQRNLTGGATQYSIMNQPQFMSDVLTSAVVYRSFPSTEAAAFTLPTLLHYSAENVTIGAGSAITTQTGFYAGATLTGATNNYGFYSDVTSAANRWGFFSNGTANNAFRGNSRFGGITAPVATVDVTGNVAATTSILSTGATAGIGYAAGAGGAVTQATSRTTGVTLNTVSGAITLVSAAGSAAYQTFTVTNSAVAATDVVIVNQKSGTDKYITMITAVAAGSFQITFATTGGTTTEQPVFNFAVIKAVAA